MEPQSSVFFPQHIVIVGLNALHLDPTLDIFVHFKYHKWVKGIVLVVHLKATMSVALQWLSNVIIQQNASAGVSCYLQDRRWRWLRLRVCEDFKMFEERKYVLVIDWIFFSIEFTMLKGFNVSGRAVNRQILLVFNLKVFRIVWFDIFKLPAVWGDLLLAWKFRATERGLLWHCKGHMEVWSIHCRKGPKLVLGLSSLVWV